MSALRLQLDRLDISLHGISPEVIDRAMQGLEGALAQRLGQIRGAAGSALQRVEIDIGAVHLDNAPDAEGLRALLVERVADALQQAVGGRGTDLPGGQG